MKDNNPLEKPFIQKWALHIVFLIIALLAYAINFSEWPISKAAERWGQFGDYFGGVINPIVGLFSIWLLLININQTRTALHQCGAGKEGN